MKLSAVTLEQVLAARERRVAIQNKMLNAGESAGNCLVCLTLNIAGEYKRSPMTRMLFDRGIRELESVVSGLGCSIRDSHFVDEITGSEAFWLIDRDAYAVKAALERVEDAFPAARLFDFDVLAAEKTERLEGNEGEEHTQPKAPPHGNELHIHKLSRKEARRCLICGRPAAECARSRAHGLDAVKQATNELLKGFCADEIAEKATAALLDELYTTPKPGLVDLANNGAHTDMDVPLFEKSAASLTPYFHDAAILGMNHCNMEELRARGVRAEQEMFEATGGVNTHKGMIYSMGLLAAGMGMALTSGDVTTSDVNDVVADAGSEKETSVVYDGTKIMEKNENWLAINYAASLAMQDAGEMLERSEADPVTNGGHVLKNYGARGAMGEAISGFPDALYCASRLRYYRINGYREPGVLAFCDCMARLEDTNLLHRGGIEGLRFVQESARKISAMPDGEERIQALEELDTEMIRRNLSPGGSADMLALAYFLESI